MSLWKVKTKFRALAIFLSIIIFPATCPAHARAAPPHMETVLYGVSYYQEYMPEERLEKDVQMMQEAGINVVRMGESGWGLWEP
ncbi:MAG: beta-galactosidase, partial [Blastocatellia bacterium]|nr:beta-galactosidase [Blastocatellia bacterium]